jgi:uncharacterized protein YjbI with pentapeptide repeats
MKKQKTQLSRLIHGLFLLALILITLHPSHIALAGSNFQPSPTNAAELYLLQSLQGGFFADLITEFPDEADRHISGDFFVNLLKDSQIQSQQEIALSGAIFSDFIYAYNINIPFSIYMNDCIFLDYIDFSSADFGDINIYNTTFEGDTYFGSASFEEITISNSTFKGVVNFGRIGVYGTMDLRNNTFQNGINLYGAYVENDFYISNSQILGTEPPPGTSYPSEFWTMRVGHTADFVETVFEGETMFASSNFHTASFYGAEFNSFADFSQFAIDRNVDFGYSSFVAGASFSSFKAEEASFNSAVFSDDVSFDSASVETLTLDDAIFHGEASFLEINITRYADILGAQFNEYTDFSYSNLGYAYLYGVVFNGPVNFYQMEIEGDAEFDGAEFNSTEASVFNNVSIGDTLGMSGIIAPAGLDLSYSNYGNLILSGDGIVNIPSINLSRSEIGKLFSLEDATITDLTADGLNVGGSVVLKSVTVTDNLDLRNAHLGFMSIDNFNWPSSPGAFNMRGMQFNDIDLGDQGLTEDTWGALLMLVNQSAYSPQAYQALSQFLADKGHPDWAAEVNLAMNRRERDEILQVGSAAWFWSWFMDGFSNYGVHPELAFVWSGLVVAIGALVYRRRDNMLPFEQEEVQLEYNPVWYSFALFIPYVDLGIASKWEPDPKRKWARYYKYIHMLLGWILTPIALLTFGGILG